MKFLPLIGAAAFFVIGQLVMQSYGTIGGVSFLISALGLWWWAHTLKEKRMDQLYSDLMKLDLEKRSEALANLPEETRGDILKRRSKDLRPNQSSQPTPTSRRG